MTDDSKVEAVIINGKTIAVRITFSQETKFYARQYAISDDVDLNLAIKYAYRYRDRILSRSREQEPSQEMKKKESEHIAMMQIKLARTEKIRTEMHDLISRVIAKYQTNEDQHSYRNVYGELVKKNTSPLSF